MEVDLPVWTIRPNWKLGVLERLEWLTDVLASETGVEQRRAVRLSPRRSFEITVNPSRAERTFLDLVLHRLGSEEWLFPLWHDQAKLTEDTVADAFRLPIDNTFREFRDGDYAILYKSAFVWDVVQIASQDATGLNLGNPGNSALAWPRGTKVYPLRRATVQTDTTLKALTTRVGESVLLFQLNEANDYEEGLGDDVAMYDGAPLLTTPPNRSQTIDLTHVRLFDETDGEVGLRYRTDDAGRAFAVQSHNWMIQGREAHAAFRSTLYTLRGRQRMVWLPSFNDDVFVAEDVEIGDEQVDIENIGMSYVGAGSPIPGRARLWTGQEIVLIAAVAPLGDGEQERLGLASPTTAAYAPGASWAFLEAARLDQDTIELHHHTDSDGTMECAAGFHTFSNVRDPSGSNFVPIPFAAKNPAPCGVDFDGVYLTVEVSAPDPCNSCWDGIRACYIVGQQPNGAGGKFVDAGAGGDLVPGSDGPCSQAIYELKENIVADNPRLSGQLLTRFTSIDFNTWKCQFFFPCEFSEVYVFPSARYCGSVGKGEGSLQAKVIQADGTFVIYGPTVALGITETHLGPNA